jgi:hypothetical protein
MSAVLLLAHQLGIFFLLRLTTPLSSSSSLANLASLGLLDLLGVLAVDLGKNLLDVRIRVCINEVAEQVG